MDSEEDLNYIPNYQQLLFQETKDVSEAADKKRKCLVQTYTASLNSLSNEDSMKLLKINLDKYTKYIDENKDIYNGSIGSNDANFVSSSVHGIDINELLKPLPCPNGNNNVLCQNSSINEESVREFMTLFNQNSSSAKPELNNESKVRKIAKSFAPRCVSKDSKLFKSSSAENFEDKLSTKLTEPIKETEKAPTTSSCFKTAREELLLQNQKKFGARSASQSQLNTVGPPAAQKRKLGARRNFQNKFVSPMLSNNLSDDEVIPKSDEWPSDQVVDDRLKNIEPRMVELIRSEIMDVGAAVVWDDIAGLEFAKTAIQEAVIWPLLRPDIFTGLRRPPKGILLFGPPGTGKTLIGKCVASQSKSTFFSISASSLTSKWIGDGEKMVRALFAVARCHQPAVIFIDEIDSLLSQRSETEHESSRRIKTEFLVQLDGATTDNDERILVIGATNRPQELDEAARRRFVKRLYIPLPEFEARFQLVSRLMASEKHVLNNENLQEIAKLSDGYSGADMKNLCSEASLGPIRSIDMSMIHCIQSAEVRPVNMDDFQKAFTRVKASVSPSDLNQYLKWNKTFGSDSSF